MNLDPAVFPRATQYIRSFSNGLGSFPEQRINRDVYLDTATNFPQLLEHAMPPELQDLITNPKGWAPEVWGIAVMLMTRDLCFESDAAFLNWTRDDVAKMYKRPAYRMLMFVMSPSLVIMGAAKRWQAFHEGSILRAHATRKNKETGRAETRLDLAMPEGLYPPLGLTVYGNAFASAIEAAGARDIRQESPSFDGEAYGYRLSWL